MVIGYVVLGVSEIYLLFFYLFLVIIVCGYGLFKFNVSCLFGELYELIDLCCDGGFLLMYVVGNVGFIIVFIVCGYVQEEYSWVMGFGLVVVGMIVGLVIFLCGNCYFIYICGVNKKVLCVINFFLLNWGWLLVLLVVMFVLIIVLFWKEWLVYVLIVVIIIGLGVLVKIYCKVENQKQWKELGLIVMFIFFSMLFWVFV